ncbi:hypothetical protein LTR10_014317 [Elasticomyces elasticus]|uniref:Methyltransferase domain-containing protein n=1 Tax=Exophiala sideris TaxID=1016849 RepID=A0ABR0JIM7_9EURO|nr:hypothetical protein LTR10_014317 [Elasticomyces elasticus]KAK5034359.1 hypothetical protein LTS07_003280 [Exophiala sideris]KAK5042656.1 hypothetical protein LTR13_001504 [Exophiala sideris]KAK5065738.1 hypothetical protein LTR69_003288 [Exophiala sideris]KAK5185802.1 hypothetical protein LTR44_001851 [Eurotiomycetes sp. CCFEE 6388]
MSMEEQPNGQLEVKSLDAGSEEGVQARPLAIETPITSATPQEAGTASQYMWHASSVIEQQHLQPTLEELSVVREAHASTAEADGEDIGQHQGQNEEFGERLEIPHSTQVLYDNQPHGDKPQAVSLGYIPAETSTDSSAIYVAPHALQAAISSNGPQYNPGAPDLDSLEQSASPDISVQVPAPMMITQIAPMMLPDLDLDDEAYAESTSTSYVTSIASEISRGILENERLYPQYGRHSYGMPVDEAEMDRMDLQHRKYELVIGDRHFLAPIGESPQSILDLATGTGIWALDVADMFPTASVLGVDIAPIQPKWVAPNCQFEIDDIEDTWTYRMESFDFIHLRDPLYVVRDWPKLMRQAYDHIKPGGWFELASVYPRAMCDDGSMPEDSMFKFICDRFIEASYGLGAPLDSCLYFAEYLRNAGFVDVAEHIFKMPSSPWPKDRRLKKVGALEMTNLVEGASAFGLRVFSHAYGWTREETELAMVGFRKDVKNRNYHQYVRYYVVYGRKPEVRDGMS